MEFKTRVLVPGRFSREETVSTGESRKTERKKKPTISSLSLCNQYFFSNKVSFIGTSLHRNQESRYKFNFLKFKIYLFAFLSEFRLFLKQRQIF